MTLGGLALAVGILVDDATVEIENIHRNLAQRKPHRAGDSRRRRADRRPGVRLDAVHLHRVRAGGVHQRGGASRSSSPLAHGGGLRDADLVPPLPHPGADAWCAYLLAAEVDRAPWRAMAQMPGPLWPHPRQGFEDGFRAAPAHLRRRAGVGAGATRRRRGRVPALVAVLSVRPGPLRSGATSSRRRRRPDQAPRPRPAGHPASRRRSGPSAGRGRHPRDHPAGEIETMLDNIGHPNSGINLSL